MLARARWWYRLPGGNEKGSADVQRPPLCHPVGLQAEPVAVVWFQGLACVVRVETF